MQIKELTKKIDNRVVLDNLSITLKKGEIVGFIGRNGSGKTTFFRSIVGHYQLDSGQILIDNQELLKSPRLKQKIFYIDDQYNFLASYPLKKINRFYQEAYPQFDQELYQQLTKKNNLSAQFKFGKMSKGMQGLYKIILAICSNADYLFFDEPLDGLDPIVKKEVIAILLDTMSEKKQSIVISSHNLTDLEMIIDRVLILKEKQIVLNYHLESLREKAKKIQLVFKTKKIPTFIKENSKLIYFQGRVVTALFEEFTETLKKQIENEEPVLFEELPLTLTDIFEANLAKEKMDYLFEGV